MSCDQLESNQQLSLPPHSICQEHTESDEEQDEFVVIRDQPSSPQQENETTESAEAASPVAPPPETQIRPIMHYVEKSQPVSECGGDVADVGEGLDCGKSSASQKSAAMTSSMISMGHSQAILDSMYMSMYGAPLMDNTHMDKLMEVFRGESEKNRTMLDQILSMIADLSKEKSHNSELRDQLAQAKEQLQHTEHINQQMTATLAEFKCRIDSDAEERQAVLEKMNRISLGLAEKDTELDQVTAQLNQANHLNQKLKESLDVANAELSHKTNEMANQSEIIKVLQEENVEMHKELGDTKKKYRERLNNLEEMCARYQERNEVNFP